MGATVFAILIFFLSIFGIGCLIFGIILFCVQRKGNKIPALKVVSIVIMVVGLLACACPIGWILFLRSENDVLCEDYVDTGTLITWEKNYESFIYDDERYVKVEFDEELFWYETCYQEDMEPVFNIQIKPDFFAKLFNAYEKEVMYEMKNSTGETLYYNWDIYCSEEVVDKVKAYYADDENYQWHVEYDEDVSAEGTAAIEVTKEELDFLYRMNVKDTEQSMVIDDTVPYCMLVKESKDKVVTASIYLVSDGETWYWDTGVEDEERSAELENSWAEFVYELPESLNDKIEEQE